MYLNIYTSIYLCIIMQIAVNCVNKLTGPIWPSLSFNREIIFVSKTCMSTKPDKKITTILTAPLPLSIISSPMPCNLMTIAE